MQISVNPVAKPVSGGCWPHWLTPVVLLPLVVAACFLGSPGLSGWTLRRVCPTALEQGSVPAPLLRKLGLAGAAEQPVDAKFPHVVEAASSAPALKEHFGSVPWPAMLEEEEVMRGLSYYGSGTGLRRVAAKLLAGQPVKIVALGGSITATGGDDRAGPSYIARLFQYINATFPHPGHTLHNSGMPGRSTAAVEPCLERLVPEGTDLVVVEFAINDATFRLPEPSFYSPMRRTYEQLVRRLLARPSKPALLVLQVYPWLHAYGDGMIQGLFYREPENQMTVVAQYYDVPVVSLRAAAWRLMHAGINGFKVDKVQVVQCAPIANQSHITPIAPEAERTSYFFNDCVHPSPQGLLALAELLVHPLERAVEDVAAGKRLPKRQADPRLEGLPPPMIPDTPDLSTSVCFMLEDFKPLVKASSGFVYKPEKPDAENYVRQKWGWSGTGPGDWAELELDTQLDAANPGTPTSVYLSFLASRKGFGTAQLNCTSGCKCQVPHITGHHPDAVTSVFVNMGFLVTQHPQCHMRVTILDIQKPDPQEGRRFVLGAVMMRPYRL